MVELYFLYFIIFEKYVLSNFLIYIFFFLLLNFFNKITIIIY